MSDANRYFEIIVGYEEPRPHGATKTRTLGNWRGAAASEAVACEQARDAVWQSRLDAEGLSPTYLTRVMPRYVVAEGWGHIFIGATESTTRWAYDRIDEKLVSADVRSNSKWVALTASEATDLLESIHDNDAGDAPENFDLQEVDALPEWASPAPSDQQYARSI